jgi:hypothetical protein
MKVKDVPENAMLVSDSKRVRIPKSIYTSLPQLNSDSGVVVSYHRTPKGYVVDDVETVAVSMSFHTSISNGLADGEVLVSTPIWFGPGPSARQYRQLWREAIEEALAGLH